jgi:predicted amidohydrolase
MFEEGRYFSAGRRVEAFDTKVGRIGMLICEDLWHVSLPYLLAMDGAEVLISLTASPTRLGGEGTEADQRRVNHDHHRAYARLLSLYSVFINRVGIEDGVGFWGGSAVMDPSGQTIAASASSDEELLTVPLDENVVRRARRGSRHVLDERPEIVLQHLERLRRR